MNLAEAFSTLDHAALDIIYDNLPFVRALSQDSGGGNTDIPLEDRHLALAEALLLARDSFLHPQHQQQQQRNSDYYSRQPKKERYNTNLDDEDESEEDEDSSLEESEEYHSHELEPQDEHAQETFQLDSTLVSSGSMPQMPIRSSSTKFQPTTLLSNINLDPHHNLSEQQHQHQHQQHQHQHRHEHRHQQEEQQIVSQRHQQNPQVPTKSNVFIVPPTVNSYDPKKDYLPQWLKRTYMYWRWTLKQPVHDVPQRYAVWISLHLNDASIRYHIQNVSSVADAGRFTTSVEVNDYILRKAAGHIKVQEDLARLEFNHLGQLDNTSVIAFNSNYLRVFNKVRHFYHPDRLAIQYYDRILPRIRKRLNVNFYERYSTSSGSTRSKSFPTMESLMLAAEQVDDFYRPLPPVPKKKTFFQGIQGIASHKSRLNHRERSREKLKTA